MSESRSPTEVRIPVPKRRSLLRRLVWLLAIWFFALWIPQVFEATVWLLAHEEVLRQGGGLQIGRVRGALWSPVVLSGVRLNLPAAGGGQFQIELESVDVRFAWRNLLPFGGRGRFFDSLSARVSRFDWAVVPERVGIVGGQWIGKKRFSFGEPMPFPTPEKAELVFREATVRSVDWELMWEGASLKLSRVTPGKFTAEKFECRVRGWSKAFLNLESRAAIQGNRLQLAPLVLGDSIKLAVVDIGLSDAVRGRVDVELQAEAFGGEVRVQAQANPGAQGDPLEASGTLTNLSMAPLGAFLGFEAAGGVLQQGKFSFRGEPSHPSRGSASLRVEAKNFQWESRQWDSLFVGATLVERRIQVPEFSLRQGKNGLVLNGEMQWPGGGSPWWKSDFGVNVTAHVDNLTELSALLLPEFTYVAGALTVDGAVRSQGGVLGGAIIVTGSKLTWRSAPIDELHAALKLQGGDVELLNVELAHGSDFLRGHGVFHVGEKWTYQGECRGQIGETARYASLLQPPLRAGVFGGGFQGEWSGKGSPDGHSGGLRVQFQNMHPLREANWWTDALSGEFAGTYEPQGWKADSFRLESSRAVIRGSAAIDANSIRLENIRIHEAARQALEGRFVLPGDFAAKWPDLDWQAVLTGSTSLECSFLAQDLNLASLASLPGAPSGLEGRMDGRWNFTGNRDGFSGEGMLQISDFSCMRGDERVSGLKVELNLDAAGLRAQNLEWESAAGRYLGYFHVRMKPGQESVLDAAVSSQNAVWRQVAGLRFPLVSKEESALLRLAPVTARGSVAWALSGPVKSPVLKGDVVVREIDFGGVPDLRAFWSKAEAARRLELAAGEGFWREWKLDLKVVGAETVKVVGTTGAARVQLEVAGTLGSPALQGEVRLALSGAVAGVTLELEPFLLRFQLGKEPELEIRARGRVGDASFSAGAVGPLSQPKYEYAGEAPLSLEKIRGVFEEGMQW